MLITRLISIDRIRGPTRSGKARHLSQFLNLSKAFFTKHAWRFGNFFGRRRRLIRDLIHSFDSARWERLGL